MLEINSLLIGFSLTLLICALTSKLTGKLGVPALLVFLVVGMVLGSEGIHAVNFESARLAQMVGVTSLVLILFSGGLDSEWRKIRPYMKEGLLLSTLGVLITTGVVGICSHYLLSLPWTQSLLLGAVVSSTDAAAIFSVFRAKGLGFSKGVKETLELESGSNDPMAVFLTVGLLQIITQQSASTFDFVWLFIQQMTLGAIFGVAAGQGMRQLLNRIRLEYEGLYPIITVACVFLVYGLTQQVGGNGFLAVYLSALVLGKNTFIHRKSLMIFHDSLAWMMQIAMFLSLGLLVTPSHLIPVAGDGLILGVVLLFLARPLSVFASLAFSPFNFREKLAISWLGLRGAMPIILATYPMTLSYNQSELLFNLVFFVVLTSTLLQGVSIKSVSKWLGIGKDMVPKKRFPFDYVSMGELRNDVNEVEVPADCVLVGQSIAETNLPDDLLILLIRREGEVFAPRGGTVFERGDVLLSIAGEQSFRHFEEVLTQKAKKENSVPTETADVYPDSFEDDGNFEETEFAKKAS